jgi:hypothetical protein
LLADRPEQAGENEADVSFAEFLDDLGEHCGRCVVNVADSRNVENQPSQRPSLAGQGCDVI